jgi:predicted peptidase
MIAFLIAAAISQNGQVQTPKSFSRSVRVEVQGSYLLYLPNDYSTTKKRFPLILFLHGSGERGNDLEILKAHGPPKEIAQGRQFPFIIVSPQCPTGQQWDVPTLEGLLDEVEQHYRVDRDREYLTGLSMGGFGTYALAAAQPMRFAAIAPISGGADASIAPKIKNLPIWATHGAMDPTVNIERERPIIQALKNLNADVRWDIVPEGGHDVWSAVYAGNSLYSWFLSHQRKR